MHQYLKYVFRADTVSRHTLKRARYFLFSGLFGMLCLVVAQEFIFNPSTVSAQQASAITPPTGSSSVFGGQGYMWLSQFANPGVLGALYLTPSFPWTGLYPIYPTGYIPIVQEEGVKVGSLTLHPFMGMAELYTDNVLRTQRKESDFITTVAPGIQAQLPFGSRHLFVADYRTNIQFFHRNPSNNVQDQTASGLMRFNLASGLKLDFQGEHKLGHDPRGSAMDLQSLELNKWTATSFTGRAEYQGGVIGTALNLQTTRWDYLNNGQGIIRNRTSNYAGVTFSGRMLPNTNALLDFSVRQEDYDENKNLDSTTYTISGGARWEASGNTTGEFLVGYQFLKFTRAGMEQPGPVLNLFRRDQDSFANLYVMGRLYWNPLSGLTLTLQPYRTIQQTVVAGTSFFTATGMNLAATYPLGTRLTFTANLGYENDRFSTPAGVSAGTPVRSDNLMNAAVGLNYRAVQWLGIGLQYVFEDRQSTVNTFTYQANTTMVSVQAFF